MNKTDKKLMAWIIMGILSINYTLCSLWYLFIKYVVGFEHSTAATIMLILILLGWECYKLFKL